MMRLFIFISLFLVTLFSQTQLYAAPVLPPLLAKSYLVVDVSNQTTLLAKEPDLKIEPASLTKLMTAYIVFDAMRSKHLSPDMPVPFVPAAAKIGGGSMHLNADQNPTRQQLIEGMISISANDAAYTLAENIAGSQAAFVLRMNAQAQKLGMKNTQYANVTGMSQAGHTTTANDLAILAQAIMRDFPEYFPLYQYKVFTYNGITQNNPNLLLWRDPTVDGMKTGQTANAGYCLVATAQRDGRRLISILIGAPDAERRANQSQLLLNYAFQNFEPVRFYQAGQTLQTIEVYKGIKTTIPVGIGQEVKLMLEKGQAAKIKATLKTRQPLLAPLTKNQVVGSVLLSLEGKKIGEYPVVTLENAPNAGAWKRFYDGVRLWMK